MLFIFLLFLITVLKATGQHSGSILGFETSIFQEAEIVDQMEVKEDFGGHIVNNEESSDDYEPA